VMVHARNSSTRHRRITSLRPAWVT
jgi:hypothetical protein